MFELSGGDALVVVAILVYFIVVLTIGFVYAKRSNSSTSEYFLGGRKVGPWFTALSAEASDMSGYLLMGLPGLAYFTGASEVGWTAIGLAIGTYLNWLLVAKRLRKYSVVANDSITVPGFYSNRFHDDKKIVGTIAAIIILIFFSVYCGSCFTTCGRLFNSLFGWDYGVMMAFGALIVFLYTMVGGYLSVVATDFVQGCLMFAALVVVVLGSVGMTAGLDNTVAFLSDIPGYLSMTTQAVPVTVDGYTLSDAAAMVDDGTLPSDYVVAQGAVGGLPLFGEPADFGLLTIISTLSWGLGYFGMPQVLVRFMGIRSEEEVKTSRRIAVVWVVISMFAAVMIGLIGRAIMPVELLTSSSAETIFIVLAKTMLPAFFCGLVVSGILAASMSSASSYLLITGSSVAENIFRGVFKKDATDNQVLIVSRITLALVLLFGVVIAWDENSVIFQVVSYAWAGLGASFGPLTLFALYWRRTNKQGAIAGMVTGAAMVLIWHNLVKPLGGVFGIYELAPAFLCSCIAIVVVSLLTKEPDQAVYDEFDHYMDEPTEERSMDEVLEGGIPLQ